MTTTAKIICGALMGIGAVAVWAASGPIFGIAAFVAAIYVANKMYAAVKKPEEDEEHDEDEEREALASWIKKKEERDGIR